MSCGQWYLASRLSCHIVELEVLLLSPGIPPPTIIMYIFNIFFFQRMVNCFPLLLIVSGVGFVLQWRLGTECRFGYQVDCRCYDNCIYNWRNWSSYQVGFDIEFLILTKTVKTLFLTLVKLLLWQLYIQLKKLIKLSSRFWHWIFNSHKTS